jgi:hypothetical protein
MESPGESTKTSNKEVIGFGVASGLILAVIWLLLGFFLSIFFGLGKGFQYSLFVMAIFYFLTDFIIGLNAFFRYDKISEGIIFCLGNSPVLGIISGISFFDAWTGISAFAGFTIIFFVIFILTTMAVIIGRVLRDFAYGIVRALGGLDDDDDEEEESEKA